MGGDRGERPERREIAGIELERAQMARTRKPQRAERDQSVALVRVPKSELRMALQELLHMAQRVGGPVDALQIEGERIARRNVARREHDRALEKSHRFLESPLGFQTHRRHIEEQGVLEPLGQRLLGDGCRASDVALLGMRRHGAQHLLVGLQVACHLSMMPERPADSRQAGARYPPRRKKRRAEARRI